MATPKIKLSSEEAKQILSKLLEDSDFTQTVPGKFLKDLFKGKVRVVPATLLADLSQK